ncbi:hypothetical protein Rsub_03832 [Raphidocelis subcapitata]|uniref:Uncharacterized protein n=1 Tax=Raphidocelis subcapitata TaxID=307507 RepID=A0A2V0P1A7_9CHLO|nr:hypothetical protein Rsub_03832 [Raphidocelis subcapitata]|eukprot:GBF90977.1 hypothetical protein Rsub_03832 [Raphidocelis subcapitata]
MALPTEAGRSAPPGGRGGGAGPAAAPATRTPRPYPQPFAVCIGSGWSKGAIELQLPLPTRVDVCVPLALAASLAAAGRSLRAVVGPPPDAGGGAPFSDTLLATAAALAVLAQDAQAAAGSGGADSLRRGAPGGADAQHVRLPLPLPPLAQLEALGSAWLHTRLLAQPDSAPPLSPPPRATTARSDSSSGSGDASKSEAGTAPQPPAEVELAWWPLLLLPSAHACAEVQGLLPTAMQALAAAATMAEAGGGGGGGGTAGAGAEAAAAAARRSAAQPPPIGAVFAEHVQPLLLNIARALSGPQRGPQPQAAAGEPAVPAGAASSQPSSEAEALAAYAREVEGLLLFLLGGGMQHTARAVVAAAERAGVAVANRQLLMGGPPGSSGTALPPWDAPATPMSPDAAGPDRFTTPPPAPRPTRAPRLARLLPLRLSESEELDSGAALERAAEAASAAAEAAEASRVASWATWMAASEAAEAAATAARATALAAAAAARGRPRHPTQPQPVQAPLPPQPAQPLQEPWQQAQQAPHAPQPQQQQPLQQPQSQLQPRPQPQLRGASGALVDACLRGFPDADEERAYAIWKTEAVRICLAPLLLVEALVVPLMLAAGLLAPPGGGLGAARRNMCLFVYAFSQLAALLLPPLVHSLLGSNARAFLWLAARRDDVMCVLQAAATVAALWAACWPQQLLNHVLASLGSQPTFLAVYGQLIKAGSLQMSAKKTALCTSLRAVEYAVSIWQAWQRRRGEGGGSGGGDAARLGAVAPKASAGEMGCAAATVLLAGLAGVLIAAAGDYWLRSGWCALQQRRGPRPEAAHAGARVGRAAAGSAAGEASGQAAGGVREKAD